MSKQKSTTHVTGAGNILFMAAAKPIVNKQSGKSEYSIKLELDATDPAVEHLSQVADYKVDTKTNRSLQGTGKVIINFSTTFEPQITDVENNVLTERDVPFFDSRVDTGKAAVAYKVVNYGDKSIVRLAGIKLLELNMAPRENSSKDTLNDTLAKLKNISQ